MRCYACNCSTENHDVKTDRYYCEPCLEPTNRVLLRQLEEEMNNLFGLGDAISFDLSFEEDTESIFTEDTSIPWPAGTNPSRFNEGFENEGFD